MGRIALIGENSVEYVQFLLNVWNRGDCAVLLDWRIPSNPLCRMIREAGVKKCIIDKDIYDKRDFTSIEDDIDVVLYTRQSNSATQLPNVIYDDFRANYSVDEAVIIYSSGTTGRAKGVVLSHFAINTNADAIIKYMKLNPSDCMYIAKALSHSSTLTGELLVALKSRTPVVLSSTIVPPRYVFNNIFKFKVSTICLNPLLLSLYVNEYKQHSQYDISSLKTVYVSGSILNDQLYVAAHDIFRGVAIYNVYGLSEAGPRVTAQTASCNKSNSVGKAIDNVEVAIVGADGHVLSVGERGVIHVKTPSLYSKYVSGQKNMLSLYGDWLNTGDVGFFDENDELHVVGRTDDVIILGAHKIYPNDVELQIANLENVVENIVTSFTYHNQELLICMYTGKYVPEETMRKQLTNCLMLHEIPNIFLKIENIPRNNNGKRDKHAIKALICKEMEKNAER